MKNKLNESVSNTCINISNMMQIIMSVTQFKKIRPISKSCIIWQDLLRAHSSSDGLLAASWLEGVCGLFAAD